MFVIIYRIAYYTFDLLLIEWTILMYNIFLTNFYFFIYFILCTYFYSGNIFSSLRGLPLLRFARLYGYIIHTPTILYWMYNITFNDVRSSYYYPDLTFYILDYSRLFEQKIQVISSNVYFIIRYINNVMHLIQI